MTDTATDTRDQVDFTPAALDRDGRFYVAGHRGLVGSAIWRRLQADEPDDFVLATGGNFTVRDFVETSFSHAGLNWEEHVKFDERYLRPTEVDALVGDASKAQDKLGWKAEVDTAELARIMVDADIAALEHSGRPWVDKVKLTSWGTK